MIFYMHKEGHKLDLIRSNPNVCIEVKVMLNLYRRRCSLQIRATFASVIGRGRTKLTEDVQGK